MNDPRRPDPLPHLATFAHAIALWGAGMPTFGALDEALQAAFGHKLFTVLVVDMEKRENQRLYSSRPHAYPVGGIKPMAQDGVYFRDVILGGQCRINRDYEDIRSTLKDHELIHSLGCEGSIHVPVRWSGETCAMLNLSHDAGWYSEADIPNLSLFAAMALPVVRASGVPRSS